jgi:nucleotide-binding universal stress UspA family protein
VVRPPVAIVDGHVDEIRQAARYLDTVARELSACGLRVQTHVRSDNVAEGILADIAEGRADVVMMATRGRSGAVRAVLGSVASEVLSRSPVPVVLLRSDSRQVSEIKKVLVPVDGSPGSALTLGAAIELAHSTGAELTLLQAVAPIPIWTYEASADLYFSQHIDPNWDKAALAGSKRYVQDVADQLREQGLIADGQAKLGEPPRMIADTAEKICADLIVMSTRGRTGAARAVLGSVADAVVRMAHTPVLLLRYGTTPLSAATAETPIGTEAAQVTGLR